MVAGKTITGILYSFALFTQTVNLLGFPAKGDLHPVFLSTRLHSSFPPRVARGSLVGSSLCLRSEQGEE